MQTWQHNLQSLWRKNNFKVHKLGEKPFYRGVKPTTQSLSEGDLKQYKGQC